jgi:hypothetical protein
MDAGLGQLGFWLFLGLIIAASILSGAIKERDKERDKQATLRALLEKDGKSVTEILAYLREKDAAEAAASAAMNARSRAAVRRLVALAIGAVTFWLGFAALDSNSTGSALLPLIAAVGIPAAGLTIAWRIWRSATRTHDAQPGA